MPTQRSKIRRLSVDVREADWNDFHAALVRRARQMSIKMKTTIKPEFSQWLRDKMKETKESYR